MEASKVTIDRKTYDLNYVGKKKKTNLRRRLIIEYIQSKPAGTVIKIGEFKDVVQMNSTANTDAFIKRMLRDGVIMRYEGDKPRNYYYSVTGAMRTVKGREEEPVQPMAAADSEFDFTTAIKNLKKAGLKFSITISNEVQ